jgi:hypothetical protein
MKHIRYNHLNGDISITTESHTNWRNCSMHPITEIDQAVIDSLQPGEKLVWIPTDQENPAGPGGLSKDPSPQRVPTSVANWRAKAIAEILGLTEQVNTIIDAMPGPEGIVMRHAWYGGGDVTRALIDSFAPQLDPVPTSEQIDAWMIQAAELLK